MDEQEPAMEGQEDAIAPVFRTAQQKVDDTVYNAILMGMDIHDALMMAGVPADVGEEKMLQYRRWQKEMEYGLLRRMHDISEKQAYMGQEKATVWLLEHLFPRYTSKGALDGTINVVLPKGKGTADVEEC